MSRKCVQTCEHFLLFLEALYLYSQVHFAVYSPINKTSYTGWTTPQLIKPHTGWTDTLLTVSPTLRSGVFQHLEVRHGRRNGDQGEKKETNSGSIYQSASQLSFRWVRTWLLCKGWGIPQKVILGSWVQQEGAGCFTAAMR